MNKVTTLHGQSLFDIALLTYGSIIGVFDLNAGAVSDQPEPGMEINPAGEILNKYVVDEYATKGIIPATGLLETEALQGIGYWIIESDLKVS